MIIRILDFYLSSILLQRFSESVRIIPDVSGSNGKTADVAFHELFSNQAVTKCLISIVDESTCEITFSSGSISRTFKDIGMDYQRTEFDFERDDDFSVDTLFCFKESKKRDGCGEPKWMDSIYGVGKDVEFKNNIPVEF